MKLRRNATLTLKDEWATKQPNQAPHLNLTGDVDSPDTTSYVQGVAGQENKYGGFDFSAIPPGSVINSISILQYADNQATQNPVVVRFALGVNGEERASVRYDVTTVGPTRQDVVFSTSGITRDELAAGLLEVAKLAIAGTLNDPPIPEGS